jgi:hypothetical protein
MARIKADHRHHHVQVIVDGPLAKRRYADWSMAFRDAKAFVRDQLDSVIEQTSAVSMALRGTVH